MVSASTIAFMNPAVSPFSTARPTRVISLLQTRALRPDFRTSASGHAAAAKGWINVQVVRGYAIAHAPWIVIQQVCRDDFVVVVRGVRECAFSVAISESPDTGYVCFELIIDLDVAFRIDFRPPPSPILNRKYWELCPLRRVCAFRSAISHSSSQSRSTNNTIVLPFAKVHLEFSRTSMFSDSKISLTTCDVSSSSRAISRGPISTDGISLQTFDTSGQTPARYSYLQL